MQNADIRNLAKQAGVYLWEIAHELGVGDATFSRWLRFELPAKKKHEISMIIDKIGETRRHADGQ